MKKKRIFRVLIVAVLFICLFFGGMPRATEAANDTVYVKKHVSLLFDNSGSMRMDYDSGPNYKWSYASYATQVFTGLLNDSDSLTVTLMNDEQGRANQLKIPVDLSGDRQAQVDKIRESTSKADGNETPLASIGTALEVLAAEGLEDAERQNEQFYLVITTDGAFEDGDVKKQDLIELFKNMLEEYPNLHLIYYAIGVYGDTTGAIDLQNTAELNAYANFTAVSSFEQSEIISTMQGLANQISGRYDVTNDSKIQGKTVTIESNGESSPVRNIALLMQNTDATLVSAEAADGTPLTIARSAVIEHPVNTNEKYEVPTDAANGYTALITTADGSKIPSGDVKLTFSEDVSTESITLMYEPAIHINLICEKEQADGSWQEVSLLSRMNAGDKVRFGYRAVEDGTSREMDLEKLYGNTEVSMSLNGSSLEAGDAVEIPEGMSTIQAELSMMDGSYQISTSQSFTAVALTAGDFAVTSSGPITLTLEELETNEEQAISFEISYDGQPLDESTLSNFKITAVNTAGEQLNGTISVPSEGVIRFTPQAKDVAIGDYTVSLNYSDGVSASETVTIDPNPATYTATAEGSLSISANEVADNTTPVLFHVTAHQEGLEDRPITAEEAKEFTISAKSADGKTLGGEVSYSADGTLAFVTNDDTAEVGDYTVELTYEGEVLASAYISIMHYDATYTVRVYLSEDTAIPRYHLDDNTSYVAFAVYADDVPLTEAQLQSMLDTGKIEITSDADSNVLACPIVIDAIDGESVLKVVPEDSASWWLTRVLHKVRIAFLRKLLGNLNVNIKVDTVKGCEDVGTLTFVSSIIDTILIVVITLMILLLVLFIAATILWNANPNVHFARSVIRYTEIEKATDKFGNVSYRTTSVRKERKLRWAPVFYVLGRQHGSYQDISQYIADRRGRLEIYVRSTHFNVSSNTPAMNFLFDTKTVPGANLPPLVRTIVNIPEPKAQTVGQTSGAAQAKVPASGSSTNKKKEKFLKRLMKTVTRKVNGTETHLSNGSYLILEKGDRYHVYWYRKDAFTLNRGKKKTKKTKKTKRK